MIKCKIASLVAAGLVLTGCSTVSRGPMTYAAPPIEAKGKVDFSLVALLSPNAPVETLEAALAGFGKDTHDRNRVAGALLLASDRNCDVYLENLRGFQSAWRTAFGLASVGLGAAGAIVTGADTARLLSGLTGAASGAQGKLDENIMGGLAAEVLVAGVRAGRAPHRNQIVEDMRTKSYPEWPVELAIADVLSYHGRCNVMSGLTTAQRAVEGAAQPTNLTVTLAPTETAVAAVP